MDKPSNEEVIERGRQAKSLLENRVFCEAVLNAQQLMFDEFLATTAEDTARREMIWAEFSALGVIRNVLNTFVQHGTKAADDKKHELAKQKNNQGD